MSEIQRYGQEWDNVIEMEDGEYVRYEDVAPLLAERDPTPVDAQSRARLHPFVHIPFEVTDGRIFRTRKDDGEPSRLDNAKEHR